MNNNYTPEVINAAQELILADCAFKYRFTPKFFNKLKKRFNTAKTTFKESSNYLFLMRETDDESLVKQATEIFSDNHRTRNSADQLDDDDERNDFRSSHIDTNPTF